CIIRASCPPPMTPTTGKPPGARRGGESGAALTAGEPSHPTKFSASLRYLRGPRLITPRSSPLRSDTSRGRRIAAENRPSGMVSNRAAPRLGMYHLGVLASPRPGLLDRIRDVVDIFWREVAKFGVIGAVAFVIAFGGFTLPFFVRLAGHLTTSKIISGVAATAFAWIGN